MFSPRLRRLAAGLGVLAAVGCDENLDVANLNAPDIRRALASAEDVQNLAISSINSWYLTTTYLEPHAMLSTTADANTSNFGNFGMRFNNLEPRIAYANLSAGSDRAVTESPWNFNYQTLGAANDVLVAVRNGLQIPGGNRPWVALARFSQAASLTNLALHFDRAFAVDEDSAIAISGGAVPTLQPYTNVRQLAAAKWDQFFTEVGTNDFTYAGTVFPITGGLTMQRLRRIAYTYAALLDTYNPRGAAEAATVNWARVATLSAQGIGTGTAGAPFDVVVQGDNVNWYSYVNFYGNEHSWIRTDHRVIRRMDGTTPAPYAGTNGPRGTSPDARYVSDFHRCGTATATPPGDGIITGTVSSTCAVVIGDPARGIYMQSNWFHKRFYSHARTSSTAALTAVPLFLAAESDLIRAEALIRTNGDRNVAVQLINNSRVTRGNLPPATTAESDATLLGYIDYERDIELLNTSGFEFARARHVDRLQAGTLRHLPVPARELETLRLPIYTFGGVGNPDRLLAPVVGTGTYGLSNYFGEERLLETPKGTMTLRFPKRTPRPYELTLGAQ